MKRITNINELVIGQQYTEINKQFNATNTVTCICDDYTGLDRPIAYFIFTDRAKKIPTPEEFAFAMRSNHSIDHTFAMWGWELNNSCELYQNL